MTIKEDIDFKELIDKANLQSLKVTAWDCYNKGKQEALKQVMEIISKKDTGFLDSDVDDFKEELKAELEKIK